MKNMPIEIIKLIALYLKPRILALVCVMCNELYDEAWYYDYLIMRYDRSEIVGRDFSFKELCARSLLDHPIFGYNTIVNKYTNLRTNGIKVISHCNNNYILKFNGDMILIDTISKLFDINVIDMDKSCYIKKKRFCNINRIDLSLVNPLKINVEYKKFYNYYFYTENTIYFVIKLCQIDKYIIDKN